METVLIAEQQQAPDVLKIQAIELSGRANDLVVTDQVSYDQAAQMALAAKDLDRQIVEKFLDPKKKAHEAHAAVCKLEKDLREPILTALCRLNRAIGEWEVRQRQIEEQRQREERERIQRERDEQIEAEAVEAEQANASPEEVRAIIERPVPTPRVAIQPTFQRQAGISSTVTWRAEVADIKALCRAVADGKVSHELVMGLVIPKGHTRPTSPALNRLAVALKKTFFVPGCQAIPDNGLRIGGRK